MADGFQIPPLGASARSDKLLVLYRIRIGLGEAASCLPPHLEGLVGLSLVRHR
jgi:hypothetical protein